MERDRKKSEMESEFETLAIIHQKKNSQNLREKHTENIQTKKGSQMILT